MRRYATPALLAASLALGGCMTGGSDDVEALRLTAAEDDAHCRALKLEVGSLVYAQCRLALRQTYLEDYRQRAAAARQSFGFVPTSVEQALRSDTFCHYDEAVKAAVDGVSPQEAASTAEILCADQGDELAQAFNAAYNVDGYSLVRMERDAMVERDIDAYNEAMAVVNGA